MSERASIYIVMALFILGLLVFLHLGSSTSAEDFAPPPTVTRNTSPMYQIELAGVYVVRLNTITGEVRFKSLVEDGNLVDSGRPLWLPDQNH